MTWNRLSWAVSKIIVFVFMAVSVPQGTWWIYRDLREAGASTGMSIAVCAFIIGMCGLGASIIWHILFRNDPYGRRSK